MTRKNDEHDLGYWRQLYADTWGGDGDAALRRSGRSRNSRKHRADKYTRDPVWDAGPERTSKSHPIPFYPLDLREDIPGALGITYAPGKRGASTSGGTWKRTLPTDVARLRDFHEIDFMVCLIEDWEFGQYKIPHYFQEVEKVGIEVHWHPVKDNEVPRTQGPWLRTLDLAIDRLTEGQTVAVHCRGGFGRAGMAAASILVRTGTMTPAQAIKHCRARRESGFCVATTGQADQVAKTPLSPFFKKIY